MMVSYIRGENMDVKIRIRQLMDERGWTIYRVAKEANIPWSTVRNMFKRDTDPSITTLEALCRAMGVTLTQFFDEDNSLGLSDEQMQLLQQWNRLSEKDRRLVQKLVESLNEKGK